MKPRRSPEEIERGLTALILAGSSLQASEVTGIPSSTLRAWKKEHPDTYARLLNDLEPKIVQKIAGESEQMVVRIFGLQHATLDQYEERLPELDAAQAAAASRNLATTSALYVDKHSSPLRERPSHVQAGQDLEGLLIRAARSLGVKHVPNRAEIDGTAEELPNPAQSSAVPRF